MCGTGDYKTRLKKYHIYCCKIIFIFLCAILFRKGHKQTSLFDQCQPQWQLQDSDEAEKAFLLYDYLPISYFLYGVFDHGWYEFQYLWLFGFLKIQVPDPASEDLWWHQQRHTSCFNPWKVREKKFFNSVSRFAM